MTTIEERKDPHKAESLLKRFFPQEPVRRTVIDVLADAVIEAHGLSADKWGTTLRERFIRVNLGRVEVVTVGRELLHLLVLETRLPRDLPEHWVLAPGHATVPRSCGVQLAAPTAADWALAHPAWTAAAKLAAETPRHSATRQAHAPGVLEFLRTTTSREVPNPLWAA